MSNHNHSYDHNFVLKDKKILKNEKKTLLVILLTFVTMVVEVSYGYSTGSMSLLADGWHMASHVGALGITYFAYRFARSEKLAEHFSFGTGKFVPLGGYTSAVALAIVAIIMATESFLRILEPVSISFDEAIIVAVVGLVVNLISALILHDSGHSHGHDHGHNHDHNMKSAFMHVLADALTSVAAIVALVVGKYKGFVWLDPAMGIVGSIVILKWAYNLMKETVWELLDGNSKIINKDKVRELFDDDEQVIVTDLHVWRIAPEAHAAEVVLCSKTLRGSDFYREKILSAYKIEHLVVEERFCST